MQYVKSMPSSSGIQLDTQNWSVLGLGLAIASGAVSVALMVVGSAADLSTVGEAVKIFGDLSLPQIVLGVITLVNSYTIHRILKALKREI